MYYINGLIGLVFLVMGLLHAPHPLPFTWVPFGVGAILAFATLKSEIGMGYVRVLAVMTTLVMFFFFAGFFGIVPKLAADWYLHQEGWEAVTLIVAGFFLIPVLSDFSCRLKAECREAVTRRRRYFFSAPESPFK